MSKKILVSGLVNLETTLKIDKFPIEYYPVNYNFFGVSSSVSGVGFNVSKALSALGNEVNLMSIIGNDHNSKFAKEEIEFYKLKTDYLFECLNEMPQSVIIYDNEGNRQMNVDLKDIQEKKYPVQMFTDALSEVDIAVLCNVNFSRPFLSLAKQEGKIVATDVHTISDIYDSYNSDFLSNADIVFMSDEKVDAPLDKFVKKMAETYDNEIIVAGMGKKGALLYVKKDDFMGVFDAVETRKVVNTVGAGDALFSAFIHFYNKTMDPYISLKKAIVFASHKIGERSASEGFLSEIKLNELYDIVNS